MQPEPVSKYANDYRVNWIFNVTQICTNDGDFISSLAHDHGFRLFHTKNLSQRFFSPGGQLIIDSWAEVIIDRMHDYIFTFVWRKANIFVWFFDGCERKKNQSMWTVPMAMEYVVLLSSIGWSVTRAMWYTINLYRLFPMLFFSCWSTACVSLSLSKCHCYCLSHLTVVCIGSCEEWTKYSVIASAVHLFASSTRWNVRWPVQENRVNAKTREKVGWTIQLYLALGDFLL